MYHKSVQPFGETPVFHTCFSEPAGRSSADGLHLRIRLLSCSLNAVETTKISRQTERTDSNILKCTEKMLT